MLSPAPRSPLAVPRVCREVPSAQGCSRCAGASLGAGWPEGSPVPSRVVCVARGPAAARNASPGTGHSRESRLTPASSSRPVRGAWAGPAAGFRGFDAHEAPGSLPHSWSIVGDLGGLRLPPLAEEELLVSLVFGELLGRMWDVSVTKSLVGCCRGGLGPDPGAAFAGCAQYFPQESRDQKFSRGKPGFCDLVFPHAVLKY